MDKTYVMITGPAASGKTTLCKMMCDTIPAHFYKPTLAYFELAQKYNIPKDRIFTDVSEENAIKHFCDICVNHELTIGDQHLAIQPKKDTAIATNQLLEIDPNEPYVSAINYSMFDKLSDQGIKTILIYLKAHPEILYERAYKRNIETGFVLRNKNLQEVIDEIKAEEHFFHELINTKRLDNLIIDTDTLTKENIYLKAKRKILERK